MAAKRTTTGAGKRAGKKRSRSAPERTAEKGYLERVMDHLRDPSKAADLLGRVKEKLEEFEHDRGPLADLWLYLNACVRLFRAYSSGEYTELPVRAIVLITVAIIYFVSPIDIIPDFIPFIGLVDDAAVIGFVIAQVKRDLDLFLEWETQGKKKAK